MSTYIYGIARRDHSGLPLGMGGVGDPARTVRSVTVGDLVAVVSDAPEGLRPKRRDLLAHQKVLSEAGAGGPVLPMRFGSLAPDDEAVVAVLAERVEHYEERLTALDGKVEYNIKAAHDEEAVLHRVLAENPEIRSLSETNRKSGGGSYDQRLHLGEMVVSAVRARETEDAAAIQHTLEPVADGVSAGPESTGWLANVSFLVPRTGAQEFLETVEALRAEHADLDLRVNGPLPPYSFVEPGPAEHAMPSSAPGRTA